MPSDYARVEQAIRYLVEHAHEQPSLGELAATLQLSPFHVQRLFHRWAGVTPKDFLQAITLRRAKQALADSASVLEASLAVGLSGSSRLHDLFVVHEAMTPGTFKAGGAGIRLELGFHPTPLGEMMLALHDGRLCGASFVCDGRERTLDEMRSRWPAASFIRASERTAPIASEIASRMRGRPESPIRVLLGGTPFQMKVWQALLTIPEGAAVSYGDLASHVGERRAARAVGSAVGQNPIAYLIPCHRVLRATGEVGEYHWGSDRKRALLAMESMRVASS